MPLFGKHQARSWIIAVFSVLIVALLVLILSGVAHWRSVQSPGRIEIIYPVKGKFEDRTKSPKTSESVVQGHRQERPPLDSEMRSQLMNFFTAQFSPSAEDYYGLSSEHLAILNSLTHSALVSLSEFEASKMEVREDPSGGFFVKCPPNAEFIEDALSKLAKELSNSFATDVRDSLLELIRSSQCFEKSERPTIHEVALEDDHINIRSYPEGVEVGHQYFTGNTFITEFPSITKADLLAKAHTTLTGDAIKSININNKSSIEARIPRWGHIFQLLASAPLTTDPTSK